MHHEAALLGLLAVMLVLGVSVFSVNFHNPASRILQSYVTTHNGDLILTGNDILTISSDTYVQTGNVIVKDNATLNLSAATMTMNVSFPYQYRIELFNTAHLIASASIIQGSSTFNLQTFNSTYVNLTTTFTQNLEPQLSDSSQTYLSNVTMSRPILAQRSSTLIASGLMGQTSVTLLGNSQASIAKSTIRSLLSKGTSRLTFSDSKATSLWIADRSKALLSRSIFNTARMSFTGDGTAANLLPGLTAFNQIAIPSIGFNATFQQSSVGTWSLDVSSASFTIRNSVLDMLTSTASTLTVSSTSTNSTLANGGGVTFQGVNRIGRDFEAFQTQVTIQGQSLYIAGNFVTSNALFTLAGGVIVRSFDALVRDQSFNPAVGAHVTVTAGGNTAVDGSTDVNGTLVFNLTFTDASTNFQLHASQSGLSATSQIQLTTQANISVQLGTGVPTLAGPLTILLLVTVVISLRIAKRAVRTNLHSPPQE